MWGEVMGFSGAQLAQVRAVVAGFFDLACCILDRVVVSNAAGSQTVSYIVSEVDVPVHVRPKRREPIESEQTGTMTAVKRFDVILPYDTSVSVKSRVAANDGVSFSVVVGAVSATQELVSTLGISPRSWLYFSVAKELVQVLSVPDSTHVVLSSSVSSSSGEAVIAATLFEVLGHDAGKSYQTKIICDCVRVDDGGQWNAAALSFKHWALRAIWFSRPILALLVGGFMSKLKVLKSFGFRGAVVSPGDVIDWDLSSDGDTMGDFMKAGLCEALEAEIEGEGAITKDNVNSDEEPAVSLPVSTR
jgi:hypothetical protein